MAWTSTDPPRQLPQQLGVVLQDTFLFDGTIRENVLFSRPNATEEQIMNACRIARVDEFAESFSDKYETVIGERGVKLSGGQRQRLSIARAILADPRILILDEATSSLDSESEAMIQEVSAISCRVAPPSSSPIAFLPFAAPSRSSWSSREGSWSVALTDFSTNSGAATTTFTPVNTASKPICF